MSSLEKLLDVMAKLRDPADGCPWDIKQDFATIAPHTIEEAYEVADAIERNDLVALRDELGDLLFQVVFHARMAEEVGAFSFEDVARGLTDKMIRRHPHVFAGASIDDATAQTAAWEAAKVDERRAAGRGVLNDVPRQLPALKRAQKLGKRAASVGFDWPDASGPREKITEELDELDQELLTDNQKRIEEELGDLLFAVTNLARHRGIDSETALQSANNRFIKRFQAIEKALKESDRRPEDCDLQELESLWQQAKRLFRPDSAV